MLIIKTIKNTDSVELHDSKGILLGWFDFLEDAEEYCKENSFEYKIDKGGNTDGN